MVRSTDRVDWYRVIRDIQVAGTSITKIGVKIGRAKATLLSWAAGTTQPKHHEGEQLIRLWCAATANGRESIPMGGQTRTRPFASIDAPFAKEPHGQEG